VSETVIGAAIAVTGAVIGAVVTGVFNWFSTKQRLEDERMKRRADYFLQEQVDALTYLYAQLEQCRQNYHFNWENAYRMTEDKYESEILGGFYDFAYVLSRASLYLDEEKTDTLYEAYEEFKFANGFFGWHVRYSNEEGPGDEIPNEYMEFNGESMEQAVNEARDVLQEVISGPATYFGKE